MVAVPGVTPSTTPDNEPTVAFALLLLQVPPVVGSLNDAVSPTQISGVPSIATGDGLTVNMALAAQPVEIKEYSIVVVPVVAAYTKPLPEPIVATMGLLLLHVPLPDASLNGTK